MLGPSDYVLTRPSQSKSAVDTVDAGLDIGEHRIPGLDEGGDTIGLELVLRCI